MKKILSAVVASTLLLGAGNVAELNINETDLEIGVKMSIATPLMDSVRKSEFGIKFMKVDAENSSGFTGTDLDYYGEMNWVVSQDIGNEGLRLGVGAKLNITEDFITMPWGLEGSYDLKQTLNYPVSIKASVYYAPQVLSFSSAESYFENRVEIEANVIDDVSLVLGYRNIKTNYEDATTVGSEDFTYNEAAYFGVKMNF